MHSRSTRFTFGLLEFVLVAGFLSVAFWLLGWWSGRLTLQQPERVALADKDGASHFSENEEEWVIRDHFRDRRGGFFVDVGANHFRDNSNTYFLETRLEWSGIAVEPQREFEADYRKHRPRTRFFPFFAADQSNDTARLYITDATSLVASSQKGFTARWGGTIKEVAAPTITLSDLLDHESVTRVDLLSIDVELHEPQVLAGFDIARFRPALVCIEAHPEVRQAILDFFANRGYVLIGRYLRADGLNLYFEPLDVSVERR